MKKQLKKFKTIEGLYVGQYSPTQGFYDVSTLTEVLSYNRNMMEHNSFAGYIPICIGTEDEVYQELEKIRKAYGRPNPTGETRWSDYMEKKYGI